MNLRSIHIDRLIGISNLFGMAALYIPFFYLVDAAVKSVSWDIFNLDFGFDCNDQHFTGNW